MGIHGARFEDGGAARAFLLAGNARITLVSAKTGTRFTYRVRTAKDKPGLAFVSVLRGASNEDDYTYLGTIFTHEGDPVSTYRHGAKSPIGGEAPSARAFAWAFRMLGAEELPEGCEVWHEGTCGRCGRALTVPSSIASGIGPECERKLKAA